MWEFDDKKTQKMRNSKKFRDKRNQRRGDSMETLEYPRKRNIKSSLSTNLAKYNVIFLIICEALGQQIDEMKLK